MVATGRTSRVGWVVALVTGGAIVVRCLRLTWQPLWWDEGYSVYFATEPLGRMVQLTAHDIHPPLYYALLHGWIGVWGSAAPQVDRLFSVLLGVLAIPLMAWLAQTLFGDSRRLILVSVFLLAISPMHLYYSQEVRMYGLAMALSIGATACFWTLVRRIDGEARNRSRLLWPAVGYGLFAVAGLYTLYYFGLLLFAHLLWAAAHFRRSLRRLIPLVVVDCVTGLAYIPWLLVAVPQLVGYVGSKVQSDQDTALGPFAYLERHLTAFAAGHLAIPGSPPALNGPLLVALVALALLAAAMIRVRRRRKIGDLEAHPGTVGALWTWLLVPALAGWAINLRFPFFPEGGERLLLIVLPFFILLLAYAIDVAWPVWQMGKIALGLMVLNAALGVVAFYTTPRYVGHDYRPLVAQIVQQGRDGDAMLAIFPWQVGYWRAYTPQHDPRVQGPRPVLLSDGAVTWSPAVQSVVDGLLAQGALWFPEPLTFGSSLPAALEHHLQTTAVNLENRWYDATRLTAWERLPAPMTTASNVDFGPVQLLGAGVEPSEAVSANQPVAVTLHWHVKTPLDLNVSLRLLDQDGHMWTSRDYAASWASAPPAGGSTTETVGLIVPVGVPPGSYAVAISVAHQAPDGSSDDALTVEGSDAVNALIGNITVLAPQTPQSPVRLPIHTRLANPAVYDGLALLGFTGPDTANPLLAGTELFVTLFLQNQSNEPPARNLYVSLQDQKNVGVAGYDGWPLPDYPTQSLSAGELLRVPVRFFVPGSLTSGEYRLVAGFQDPASGVRTPPVMLGVVSIRQRVGVFDRPAPSHDVTPPAQFGTHVRLIGYDIAAADHGDTVLRLYWEVLQPLLPPHHIFVHADAADSVTLAQQDGPPVTADGIAPSGSWQPGEFLTTVHTIHPPVNRDYILRVGLYEPETGVRLPVTVDGRPAGDNVVLPYP